MQIQKILRKWPFIRGRDRFFRMLTKTTKQKFDNLDNLILLKNGIQLFVSKGDYLSYWLRCFGEYEVETSRMLQKHSKPNQIFLDIGANLGIYSLEVAKLLNMQVVSVEPNPKLAKLLRRSIQINELDNKIKLLEVALANETGQATFVEHPTNKGGSALAVDATSQTGIRYDVTVEKLDESPKFQTYINNSNAKVGLIKMDIEGAEENALKGMSKLLSEHKPTIIIELLDSQLKLFGSSKESIINLLQSFGYQLHLEFDGNGLFIQKVEQTTEAIRQVKSKKVFHNILGA